jgi:hypothetical protein
VTGPQPPAVGVPPPHISSKRGAYAGVQPDGKL